MESAPLKREGSVYLPQTSFVVWKQTRNGVAYQSIDLGNIVMSMEFNSYLGYNIPSFHRRVRAGELLPHTPWLKYEGHAGLLGEATYDFSWRPTSSSTYTYRNYTEGGYGYPGTPTASQVKTILDGYSPPESSYLVQKAAADMYTSGFDALTFIAEFAEIPRLLTGTCTKLVKLRLPKTWKQFSNEWLSWRYGWRTLAYDLQNLKEAIDDWNDTKERHSKRAGFWNSETYVNSGNSTVAPLVYSIVTEDKVKVSRVGSVTADIEVPKILANVAITAWEVIPLSFVIDWLVSIGKSIAATQFLMFNTKYSASYGHRVELQRISTSTPISASTGYVWLGGTNYKQTFVSASKEQRVPCHVPLTPHFKLNINPYKILDLLGLVIQRLK